MFSLKLSKRRNFGFFVLILFSLCLSVYGQNQSSANAKKNKGKADTCDGAADIVPAKPMSFVRKRRPTPKAQSAESKNQ